MSTLLAASLLLACSSSKPVTPPTASVLPRAATAGDALLRYLPTGADVVVEIDLARLRNNAVIGETVRAWLSAASDVVTSHETASTPAPDTPLAATDSLLIAAYGVGTSSAATATFLAGYRDRAAIAALGAVDLDLEVGVVVLAPPELARRAEAVASRSAPSLAGDSAFLDLRARAMPERAEGASLRVTARLSFDAQVALAALLDADAVPAALSVWADVADDAALIAELEGSGGDRGADEGARLEAAITALRQRLLQIPLVRAAGLPPALRRARIDRHGAHLRVVAVIGPQHLRRAAEYLAAAAPHLTKESSP